MLQTIAVYLFKTIIIIALLLFYYMIALRNNRFHYYNRFYLLSAVVLSIALPFINIPLFTFNSSNDKAITVFQVIYAAGGESTTRHSGFFMPDWQQLTCWLLMAVAGVLLLHLACRIVIIYRLKRKFPVSHTKDFDFINTDLEQAPFSFFKNVFWRKDISPEEATGHQILQHELTHIREKHSWDKLFMQVVTAIIWPNPLYWFIQKELSLIHEFIADDKAITDSDTSAFASMLLKAHFGNFKFDPAQPFFYSSIKRRLIMLTTSKASRFSYLRRMMALPLLACIVLLFAFRLQKQNGEAVTKISSGRTFALIVDAGHGGKDAGATGLNGVVEKDINLNIAKAIKALSPEYGIEVILTRDNDITMSVGEKTDFSNSQHADAFISVHANVKANESSKTSGMEICISPDNAKYNQSKILGSALVQSLDKNFSVDHSLIQRPTGIWVLKANMLPAVLIECGFIDDAKDMQMLQNKTEIENIARNILEGVAAYANTTSNENNEDTTAPRGICLSCHVKTFLCSTY